MRLSFNICSKYAREYGNRGSQYADASKKENMYSSWAIAKDFMKEEIFALELIGELVNYFKKIIVSIKMLNALCWQRKSDKRLSTEQTKVIYNFITQEDSLIKFKHSFQINFSLIYTLKCIFVY